VIGWPGPPPQTQTPKSATSERPALLPWLQRVSPAYRWDWPHLRYIQDALERVTQGELRRLLICIPPRHGKSELATVRYSVYRLVNDPGLRIIVGAYNQILANKFSRKARRIAEVELQLASDRYAVEDWETTAGGGVRAVGVGGGITGQGGDLIVIDDPVKSREEAESQAYRDRCWEWYTDDLYTRLEPGGAVILIMTRWHADDLAGRILASETAGEWTVINLPAEAEEGDPLGRPLGAPLCPERYDSEALADRRRVLGAYGYNALYGQRPSPPEGGMLKRSWWRRYDTPPERFDEVIQSWDMTFKDTKASDFVCGQVWGRRGAEAYLLDLVWGRFDIVATLAAVRALSARWPQATAKYVEDKANGPAVIAMLRQEIGGMIAVEPEGGKVARVVAVSPTIEAGNVYLPRFAPWADAFIEECAAFPTGANDDQVDAMSQALLKMLVRINAVRAAADAYARRRAAREQEPVAP
jgi:predicted phage terminase large subunit-like protein